MRMIDVVRIDDILAGPDITCYQSYRNETTTTVSSRRAAFIELRPRPRLVCNGYSRCLPPKRWETSNTRAKKRTKKAPGRDLRLPDDLGLRPDCADAPIASRDPSLWKFRGQK